MELKMLTTLDITFRSIIICMVMRFLCVSSLFKKGECKQFEHHFKMQKLPTSCQSGQVIKIMNKYTALMKEEEEEEEEYKAMLRDLQEN